MGMSHLFYARHIYHLNGAIIFKVLKDIKTTSWSGFWRSQSRITIDKGILGHRDPWNWTSLPYRKLKILFEMPRNIWENVSKVETCQNLYQVYCHLVQNIWIWRKCYNIIAITAHTGNCAGILDTQLIRGFNQPPGERLHFLPVSHPCKFSCLSILPQSGLWVLWSNHWVWRYVFQNFQYSDALIALDWTHLKDIDHSSWL